MVEEIKNLVDPLDLIAEHVNSSKNDLPIELITDEGENDDIALKTDLIHKEHVLVTILSTENDNLKDKFKDFDLYGNFLNHFKRHKLSLNRQSRTEFSETLRGGVSNKDLENASNIKNLMESRK